MHFQAKHRSKFDAGDLGLLRIRRGALLIVFRNTMDQRNRFAVEILSRANGTAFCGRNSNLR